MSAKDDISFWEFDRMCKDAGISDDNPQAMEVDYRVGCALSDMVEEIEKATSTYPAFNSAHEGYAILKEEVDELWAEVMVKQGSRDIEKMRREAIQVAAMAIRFIADVCYDGAGQN